MPLLLSRSLANRFKRIFYMAELIIQQRAFVSEVDQTPGKPTRLEGATRRGYEMVLLLVTTAIVLMTWQISRAGYFTSGSDVGYWLGVAGGTMMLLLFT